MRILIIILLSAFTLTPGVSQTSQVLSLGSNVGNLSLKDFESSSRYIGFSMGLMRFNSKKISFGTEYYGGFSLENKFAYQSTYSSGWYGSAPVDMELTYKTINIGVNVFAKKYVIGNYFDGGLFLKGKGALELLFVRGDNKVLSSDPFNPWSQEIFNPWSYDLVSGPDYTNFEGFTTTAAVLGLSLGYTLPLSKRNLEAYLSFDKSVFAISFEDDPDEENNRNYSYITLGIKYQIIY